MLKIVFMHILQAGVAGLGYVMAKELRKKGIKSDILISKQHMIGDNSNTDDPRNLDQNLDSFPDWVHIYDLKKKGWKLAILKEMRNYDLIHSNMEMPIFAMLSRKPYIAQSIGDDLRDLAFRKSIKGRLLRKAYMKADLFIFSWPPHKPYTEKLGLKNVKFIPWVWDTEIFSSKQKNKIRKDGDNLTLFHPMIQNWEMKGNDKFLRAFVKLCKEKRDIFLYLILWGPNEKDALKLLSSPEVKERVKVISGPISRQDIVKYMAKADILVDQFNSGSFTRVGMEAMSFGLPILMNLDEKLHEEIFGEIPSVINSGQDYIYERLNELINSKKILSKLSLQAKEWFSKHYDNSKIIDKYVEVYETLLKK